MKKTLKVIFNFKLMCDFYPHATRWQQVKWHIGRGVRNTSIVGLFVLVGSVSAGVYRQLSPVTVYADKEVIKEVEAPAPVMDRIAKCESNNSHYKNGQVLIKPNVNGTVDIGRYQVNSVWNKKATEMGLDLTKEADNKTFAMWIYKNRGTQDWYSSVNCWSK